MEFILLLYVIHFYSYGDATKSFLYCSFLGPSNNRVKNATFLSYTASITNIGCSFLNNQSYYCLICCSTDPSVPPASYVYSISTTSGTDVTVSLGGLTSGQMYYCKAAATFTNSIQQCSGSVIGGVKRFTSFTIPVATSSTSGRT